MERDIRGIFAEPSSDFFTKCNTSVRTTPSCGKIILNLKNPRYLMSQGLLRHCFEAVYVNKLFLCKIFWKRSLHVITILVSQSVIRVLSKTFQYSGNLIFFSRSNINDCNLTMDLLGSILNSMDKPPALDEKQKKINKSRWTILINYLWI